MRILRLITLIFVLITLGLIGVGQARGDNSPPTIAQNITWTRNTIASSGNVGSYASLAIDPTTDLPQISYYDSTNNNLSHAYMTNDPINTPCPVAGWECESWSTTGTDGSYTAIDIRDNGNYGIFYLKEGDYKLYLRGDQGDNQPLGDHYIALDQNSYGSYGNSLHYDRFGIPHVSYITGYFSVNNFYYAKYIGSDGACLGDGWDCEFITSSSTGGPADNSLGVTYYGSPRVAIGDVDGLAYASRVGTNGSCGNSIWQCNIIEDSIVVSAVSLYQPTCQIICTEPVQIAYLDLTNGRLKIATGVTSGGNCGVGNQAGKWRCDIIETTGTHPQYGVSLFRYNNQPYIIYTDGDDRANATLKIAYPSPGGNCGPILNGAGSWQCETIDTGLRYTGGFPFYHDVGLYPSFEINTNGTLYAAYYDSDAGDLLVAEAQLDAPPPPPTWTNKVYLPSVLR